MGKVVLKLTQGLSVIGILLLIVVNEMSWTDETTRQLKIKSKFIRDGDTMCTIIFSLDRSRLRVFFDGSKKIVFMVGDLSNSFAYLPLLDFLELKALLLNVYQRNVFYVYVSSVP